MYGELKTQLHNKFDIEVKDASTGVIKQRLTAYNIVLDSMWTRLCNFSAYFSAIHVGTGTGALDQTRTALFTFTFGRTADLDLYSFDDATSVLTVRKKIVINPEEYVGSVFTEVGVAYGTPSSNLVTHALIKDSEGTPISITKTDSDVLTIYATVYATFIAPSYGRLCTYKESNPLLSYLGAYSVPDLNYRLGTIGAATNLPIPYATQGSIIASKAFTPSADVPNKRRIFPVTRFSITEGNGHIKEVTLGDTFNFSIPNSVYEKTSYADAPLTVVDASIQLYNIPSHNIDATSLVVSVNGIEASITLITAPSFNKVNARTGKVSILSNGLHAVVNANTLARVYVEEDAIRYETLVTGTSTYHLAGEDFYCDYGSTIKIRQLGTGAIVYEQYYGPSTYYASFAYGNSFYLGGTGEIPYVVEVRDGVWGRFNAVAADYSSCAMVHPNNKLIASRYGTTLRMYERATIESDYSYTSVAIPGAAYNSSVPCFISETEVLVSTATAVHKFEKVEGVWQLAASNEFSTISTGFTKAAVHNGDLYGRISTGKLFCTRTIGGQKYLLESDATSQYDPTWMSIVTLNGVAYLVASANSTYGVALYSLTENVSYAIISDTIVEGDVITADYDVEGIHKTDQYVLDVGGYIQFGGA